MEITMTAIIIAAQGLGVTEPDEDVRSRTHKGEGATLANDGA
jgi:hypothetical protein